MRTGMTKCVFGFAAPLALLVTLTACAGTPAALEPQAVRASTHTGYLNSSALQALATNLPPPPIVGSVEEAADQARSKDLRRFEGTDRWLLATSHAEVRSPLALQHFDCALGVRFDPQNPHTPATARIFSRLFEDAEAASSLAKLKAYRARPVWDDPSRPACQTLTDAGRATASYPSGTATVGAAYGAAMAVISPQDAQASKNIGREIGSSRAICGMHYPLDVLAGSTLGEMVFEQAQSSPVFQADLVEARQEIIALKAEHKTNPACAAERSALAMTQDLRP